MADSSISVVACRAQRKCSVNGCLSRTSTYNLLERLLENEKVAFVCWAGMSFAKLCLHACGVVSSCMGCMQWCPAEFSRCKYHFSQIGIGVSGMILSNSSHQSGKGQALQQSCAHEGRPAALGHNICACIPLPCRICIIQGYAAGNDQQRLACWRHMMWVADVGPVQSQRRCQAAA